jgi:hypothetical protein
MNACLNGGAQEPRLGDKAIGSWKLAGLVRNLGSVAEWNLRDRDRRSSQLPNRNLRPPPSTTLQWKTREDDRRCNDAPNRADSRGIEAQRYLLSSIHEYSGSIQ